MKNETGFFKTIEDQEHGWTWNGYPVEKLDGIEVQINDNKVNITPGNQKVLVDQSYNAIKSMNDTSKVVFRDMLQKLNTLTIYQQKNLSQVVISLLKTILIMM